MKRIIVWSLAWISLLLNVGAADRGATAEAVIFNGFVVGITITDGGAGYQSSPVITFSGGGGSGATAVATVTNGAVQDLTITSAGLGYTSLPTVKIGLPVDTTSGLVVNYTFDNGLAQDMSGNGNHAQIVNALAATDRSGFQQAALEFKGNYSYVILTNRVFNIGQPYTFNVWVSTPTPLAHMTIFDTIPHPGVITGFSGTPGHTGFALGDGVGWTFSTGVGSKGDYQSNTWYMMTFVKNGATFKTYINGILDCSVVHSNTFNCMAGFFLGTWTELATTELFNGKMDDFRLYNRTLNEAEIKALFAEQTPAEPPHFTQQLTNRTVGAGLAVTFESLATGAMPITYQWWFKGAALLGETNASLNLASITTNQSGAYFVTASNDAGTATSSVAVLTVTAPMIDLTNGLIVYYTFEGGVAQDMSGHENDGQVVNTVTATDREGISASALEFNGTSSYVKLSNQVFNLGQPDYAFNMWFSTPTPLTAMTLFNTIPYAGITLDTYGSPAGHIGFYLGPGNAYWTLTEVIGPKSDYQPNTWYMMTFVKRGAEYRTYINGVVDCSDTHANTFNCMAGFFLGSADPNSFPSTFKGKMDDFRFYNRALSEAEINALFTEPKLEAPLQFFQQPISQSFAVGQAAILNAAAIGTPPINYQWWFKGSALVGETNSQLNLTSVTTNQSGEYYVIASNANGAITSSIAIITVTAPVIDLKNGLIVYYTFDAGAARDISGHGNDARIFNISAAEDRVGNSASALAFNGTTSYLILTNQVFNIGQPEFAFNVWVSTPTLAPAESMTVFDTIPHPGIINGFYNSPAKHTGFSLGSGTSWTLLNVVGAKGDYQPDGWYMMTFVKKGTEYKQYINGILDCSAIHPNTYNSMAGFLLGAFTPNAPYGVFNGKMDDFRLYNRALSESEINALFTEPKSDVAPQFFQQPTNQTVAVGQSASFAVIAAGTMPITYQWWFKGSALAGETNAQLRLTSASTNQSGEFLVTASNVAGAATSSVAVLTVVVPPKITVQPSRQEVIAGATATFSSLAAGDAPLSYQWRFNNVNVADATNEVLTLTNVVPSLAGRYSVVASNPFGSATSLVAELCVIAPPMSQTVVAGGNASLSVAISSGDSTMPQVNSGTLRLWLKADQGVITNQNVVATNGYYVTRWEDQSGNNFHAIQTSSAKQPVLVSPAVPVSGRPAIRFDGIQSYASGDMLRGTGDIQMGSGYTSFLVWSRADVYAYENIIFSAGVPNSAYGAIRCNYIRSTSGIANETGFGVWGLDWGLGYSAPPNSWRIWTDRLSTNKTRLNSFETDGITTFSTNQTLTQLVDVGAGYYIGGLGSDTTVRSFKGDIAEIIVFKGELTEQDRLSVDGYLRQKYYATALPGAFVYQWLKSGVAIVGQTNANLTFTNVTVTDAGQYQVVISSTMGIVTSKVATVTVLTPPAFTLEPAKQGVISGKTATFVSLASGDAPLTYQWKFNDSNINGATNEVLTLTNVSASQAGRYWVVASNPCGSATSVVATLLVIAPPVIASQPQGQTVASGGNAALSVGVNGEEATMPPVGSGTLRLWLKADAGVVTNQSVVATNAYCVTRWEDQSGNNFHASQSLSDKQPVLVPAAAGLSGRPAIHFDGIQTYAAGDMLRGTNDLQITGGYTSFLVWSRADYYANEQIIFAAGIPNHWYGAIRSYEIASALNGVTNELIFSTWTYAWGLLHSVPPNTWRIWTDRMNTNQSQLNVYETDGVATYTTNQALSGLVNVEAGYYIGGLGSDTAVRSFQGDIAEIIIFKGELTEQDRLSVDGYLRQKYYATVLSSAFVFQWLKGGEILVGQTNANLALTNVSATDAGQYQVVIRNTSGVVTSQVATVTVLTPPTFTLQPVTQKVIAGKTVTFASLASGDAPLTYQWKFNNVRIVDATNEVLTLTNATISQAGRYTVVANNSCGSTTSVVAELNVITPPVISSQPQGQTVASGGNAALSVGVNGGAVTMPPVGSGTMRLWLKADAGVVTNQSVMATNGYYVTRWEDQSGNNFHASQSLSDKQPVLVPSAAGLSGRPAIHFDGTQTYTAGDMLRGTNDLQITGGYTSFLVWSRADYYANEQIIFAAGIPNHWYGAIRSYEIASALNGVTNELIFSTWTYAWGLLHSVPPNTWRIWTDRMNTNQSQLSVFETDGVATYTTNQALSGLVNVEAGYYIGGLGSDTPVRSFQGDIAEIVIFKGELSEQDRLSVDGYLRQKYYATALPGVFAYQWLKSGVAVLGQTNASLRLTNSSMSDAGQYQVVISNAAGVVTSEVATVTVLPPPALLRAMDVSGMSAKRVTVPIYLTANGNENGLSFSLSFDTSQLQFSSILPGRGMANALFLPNTFFVSNGLVGAVFAMAAEEHLAAGVIEVAQVVFDTPISSTAITTTVSFVDQPIDLLLADENVQPLPMVFQSSTVTLAAVEYEGDVWPRVASDRKVDIYDVGEMGRIVAGLDIITNASEFQKADCAPRSTAGNGILSVADWVQAARYAAGGLDPMMSASGPTSPIVQALVKQSARQLGGVTRVCSIVTSIVRPGEDNVVVIAMTASGDENALGFSLNYDPAVLVFKSAAQANPVVGARLIANSSNAGAGKLGIVLALPLGQCFVAGSQQMIRVAFTVANSSQYETGLSFGNSPVMREVADSDANSLFTSWENARVWLVPAGKLPPVLAAPAAPPGGKEKNLNIAWTTAAGNVVLEYTDRPGSDSWTPVGLTPQLSNLIYSVTIPATSTNRFFRLKQVQ